MGVTIYDIAARANVSIATVSRVFNNHPRVSDDTRARVLAVADEVGYQPHLSAQSLARRKTNLISAVIPMMTNYFYLEVLRGMQDFLIDSEYDLLVYSAPKMAGIDGQLERALQRGRGAGVLLFSTPLSDEKARRLRQNSQPVMLVDSFHQDFDSVSIDNRRGGHMATQHLVAQGCRRIGMIMANPKSVPAQERRAGYEAALCEAGRPSEEALVVVSQDERHHGFSEAEGEEAMRQLLRLPEPPDGVFATSDIQALGAMRALQDAGLRMPEDVAVIGFDDIRISQYVSLSTLQQPMYEMGKLAVEKLLERVQNPDSPTTHTVFSPRLVARATTTCTDSPAFALVNTPAS